MEREGQLTRIKVGRRSPAISHLLFTCDSLLFCKAEVDQCQIILYIIGKYGKASGQNFNFDKSSVMFGRNVPNQTKEQLKNLLGISKEGELDLIWEFPKV